MKILGKQTFDEEEFEIEKEVFLRRKKMLFFLNYFCQWKLLKLWIIIWKRFFFLEKHLKKDLQMTHLSNPIKNHISLIRDHFTNNYQIIIQHSNIFISFKQISFFFIYFFSRQKKSFLFDSILRFTLFNYIF